VLLTRAALCCCWHCQTLLLLLLTVQAAGLVPIVEPELLIEGVHTAQEFAAATERTLGAIYAALSSAQVHLEVCYYSYY
jgi:fructose-bisphosphate aldolase, class I